jgi:hypothetical protein
MQYINLTPHTLNMTDGDIEPSGTVARLVEEDLGDVIRLGSIVGLPDPMPGTKFVVARPLAVALALQGVRRDDVVVVKKLLRDEKGVIVGAEGFARVETAN